MTRLVVITAFITSILLAEDAVDTSASSNEVVTPKEIQTSLLRGVDYLVRSQNPNGSWGGPTRTKQINIYAPLPGAHHAFRAGSSGLALSGLLDSGDTRPETLAAIKRGGEWMEKHLPDLRRADPTTTYNIWGHAYGLRALTRLYLHTDDKDEKAKWKKLAQEQINLLNRYDDLNGGWGYLDVFDGFTSQKPSGITTAFTTATVLLAMHEAREVMEVKLDDKMNKYAIKSINVQRQPDHSYVYSFSHRVVPRRPINRPAGSLARSQACNAALRAFGDETVTNEVIETWLQRFVDREGFLSIARKKPIPHESHFAISGYFYYYGIYYFTESADILPKTAQKKYATELAKIIIRRQEKDGSWWDYPLYDYHQAYGTGYTLMALSWCSNTLTEG